jgi:hypothetical protein
MEKSGNEIWETVKKAADQCPEWAKAHVEKCAEAAVRRLEAQGR